MSKFRKKKKGMPAVNTASLPDIVFMLLFFFMVTTTMRETESKIKKISGLYCPKMFGSIWMK